MVFSGVKAFSLSNVFSLSNALTWFTYFVFYYLPGIDCRLMMERYISIFPSCYSFVVITTVCVTFFSWVLAIVPHCFFYYYQFAFIEQFRTERKPKEWNPEYRQLIKRTILMFFLNQLLSLGSVCTFFMLVGYDADGEFKCKEFVRTMPNWWENAIKIFIGLLMFETIFYWGHWLSHTKFLYQWHKVHHEYVSPISLTGTYGSILDHFFQTILPGFVPIIVLRYHVVTVWIFTVVSILHSGYDHGCYEFAYYPFQLIPFSGHIRAHTFHHNTNMGNYALYWRFWDRLMGTDKEYNLHLKKQKYI